MSHVEGPLGSWIIQWDYCRLHILGIGHHPYGVQHKEGPGLSRDVGSRIVQPKIRLTFVRFSNHFGDHLAMSILVKLVSHYTIKSADFMDCSTDSLAVVNGG